MKRSAGNQPEGLGRRDLLKMAAGAVTATALLKGTPASAGRPAGRRVVVAGAGIAGLSCAYELVRRGHDVTVLEASGRTGGHVMTVRDGLAEGFYVDAGAENFTRPGYDICWSYIEEFQLTAQRLAKHDAVSRRIGDRFRSDEQLRDRTVLSKLGFNGREIDHLVRHPRWSVAELYFAPYLDRFENEYKPLGNGLDHLDSTTVTELLKTGGASATALRFAGSERSALSTLWHHAILKLRGASERQVYRIRGGNQKLTDALTEKLGDRVWRGCPLLAIRHGESGVTVLYKQFNREEKQLEADYLVSCLSLPVLAQIPVTPAWSEAKSYAIQNIPYYSSTRIILQSRTPFWEEDGISPNLSFGHPHLSHVWRMAEEVESGRGLLVGTASGAGSGQAALEVFRAFYPGQSENIEQAREVAWPLNPLAAFCERTLFPPGELPKLWPALMQPEGRIHFAGAYADNLHWGMEAATRSARRVAESIG